MGIGTGALAAPVPQHVHAHEMFLVWRGKGQGSCRYATAFLCEMVECRDGDEYKRGHRYIDQYGCLRRQLTIRTFVQCDESPRMKLPKLDMAQGS